ncbi:MAG: polyphosphate kinase 2 family protein [Phycisphaerales bacterium]|nr:polyphosphate kinase 2 family protein [Phycisphaerales bacterium]
MNVADLLRVRPGSPVDLRSIDASGTPGLEGPREQEKAAAATLHQQNCDAMQSLQYLLWAERRQALLVVLQGMDTAGKDGTIRNVYGVLNPQGVRVTAFTQPTERELAHDFLWRVHRATPAHGQIVIFNRSHYEDVTVVRVQNLAPKEVWSKRYEHINAFERLLVDSGTSIIKIFLHIDRDEQKQRIESRLSDPTKSWKFAASDISERKHWDDYTDAYNDAISKCSTAHAPWFVVPANRKWYRNWAISTITRHTLEKMNPRTPAAKFEAGSIKVD